MLIMSKTLHLHLEKSIIYWRQSWKVKHPTNKVSHLERKSLKLYNNLRKPDIIDELHQKLKFTSSLLQKQLMDLLLHEMHGIQIIISVIWLSQSRFRRAKFIPIWDTITWATSWYLTISKVYTKSSHFMLIRQTNH